MLHQQRFSFRLLANRPKLIMGKYLGYNYTTITTASFSDHWCNLRRIRAIDIFSSSCLNAFACVWKDEVQRLLVKLSCDSHQGFTRMELKPMISGLTLNNIMRMVEGKSYYGNEVTDQDEVRELRELIAEAFMSRTVHLGPRQRRKYPTQRGFDNLLELDDKGDVSTRDNGSGLGRFSRLIQISTERLAELLAYHFGYNYTTVSTASYGDHWRNLRRIGAIEIFSSTRLNAFASVRKDEVRRLLVKLSRDSRQGFARVELKSMLSVLTFNNIMRMVAGKRYYGDEVTDEDEARELRELIAESFSYGGSGNLADYLPVLNWFGGYEKKVKRVGEKMDR
ncbi:hypothetical protein GQ457_08G015030 [Hibiscus cannabinus]